MSTFRAIQSLRVRLTFFVLAFSLVWANLISTRANADIVFDVTAATYGLNGTASGTSNGIGFTFGTLGINESLSVTNGTYTGFSSPVFHNPPLALSDSLHIGGTDFVLTFDQPIRSALIYITDNLNGLDGSLDFGIVPTILSGDVSLNGTRFRPTTISGGLVRLDNINSNFLAHTTSDPTAALNFAIVATAVPEPSSIAMISIGASMIVLARRHRRNNLRTINKR